MAYSIQGQLQEQVSFLRRQFLQDGGLPFTDVLSEAMVKQALTAVGACWLDRIYSPLVLCSPWKLGLAELSNSAMLRATRRSL
jgi:hypothetical protein